jgi:hypothetical protein
MDKNSDDNFFLEQFLVEYQRRSDVLHKAIDNSYAIFGITFSALAAILVFNVSQIHPATPGAIPFVILCLLYLDSQIRTTVFTNAKHIALLEGRINKLADYPLLLWESKLSPANIFYYKPNKHLAFRAIAITPYLILAVMVYGISINQFHTFIFQNTSYYFVFFSLSAQASWIIYLIALSIPTIACLYLWFYTYIFLQKEYEKFLSVAYKKATTEFKERK